MNEGGGQPLGASPQRETRQSIQSKERRRIRARSVKEKQKRAEGVAHVVQRLPSKPEVLRSSSIVQTIKQMNKQGRTEEGQEKRSGRWLGDWREQWSFWSQKPWVPIQNSHA
jgi:hypothetical protein